MTKRFSPNARMSPLTIRIMAVNLIAVVFLALGMLYLDQYQDKMTTNRINALIKDAEIMAGALGETATVTTDTTDLRLQTAEQIIIRVVGVTHNRTRLFGLDGRLLIDSRDMAIDQIVIDSLPHENTIGVFGDKIMRGITLILDSLQHRHNLEVYHEVKDQMARHYPEVVKALEGEVDHRIRRLSDGSEIISVAVPIQRFHRVLGSLMLTADTRDIQESVAETRLTFFKFFALVLLVTLLLSLFLARTIVRPIVRLARSADQIGAGTHTSADIPDYSARKDEIGDLSHSLKSMTLTLARQIDAVAAFAADVTHELKNPLTSLRSAVETLTIAKSPLSQEKLRGIIAHDVVRLDRLITDISFASRLDAEMSHGRMTRLDLRKLLESIIDLYSSSQNGMIPYLQLEVMEGRRAEGRNFDIQGLEGQLGQLFRNLIDNAISFSGKDRTIWIRLSKSRDYIQVAIEDEGPGIPDDRLEDIFERFYTERPKEEGFGKHSGLGLSICRKIIEAHGGTILAENRFGPPEHEDTEKKSRKKVEPVIKGARFIVRLRPWSLKMEKGQ